MGKMARYTIISGNLELLVYRAAFFFVGRSNVSTYNRYRVYAGGSFHSFEVVGAM